MTKSKRIPVERQTTFERVETDSTIEQTIQIKSIENPHRLALVLYSSPDQNSFLKHLNSTRTSSKLHRSHSDENSTLIQQQSNSFHPEQDLSVVNIRTRQGSTFIRSIQDKLVVVALEVEQSRRRENLYSRRSIFPTSIVTNANLNSPRATRSKLQQGRPIPSVFLTEDPVS